MNQQATLQQFADSLASSSPTPGGGGAAGYTAALAGCLANMVIALTKNKSKFLAYQDKYQQLSERLNVLTNDLLDSIHQDEVAFLPLAQAYGLDKNNPDRDRILEKCLLDAALAPLNILQNVCQVVDCLEKLAPISSKLVISDVASGAALASGAILASSINVKVNTKLMKNKTVANDLNLQVNDLVKANYAKSLALFETIEKEMTQ